jgi:hypothetical protein
VGAVGEQQWRKWPRFGLLSDIGIPAPGWPRPQRGRRR